MTDFSIILVEPQGDLNIGSVCRAMMNFGYTDLRLVKPRVDHLTENARKMAVKATTILENASVFPGIGCNLSLVATEERGGVKMRSQRMNCVVLIASVLKISPSTFSRSISIQARPVGDSS